MWVIALAALLGVWFISFIVGAPLPAQYKFAFGALFMFGLSRIIAPRLKLKEEYGVIMIRTEYGIGLFNALARKAELWNLLCDFGTALGFGALSYFMINRPPKEKAIIVGSGLVFLAFCIFLVSPGAFAYLLPLIGKVSGMRASNAAEGINLLQYALVALIVLGGFALASLGSLFGYAISVLWTMFSPLFSGAGVGAAVPGATLILPGINIPFMEGLIALAAILIVHETGHAVMTVIARARIISSGVVLFGILPIGAFVEPDEAAMNAKSKDRQTRMLIAGSTANILASVLSFALLVAFLFATSGQETAGALVIGGTMNGRIVESINGTPTMGFLASNKISANETLQLSGAFGTVDYKVEQGMAFYGTKENFFLAFYSNPALQFIYNVLGLLASLNMIIGMVNLIPVPMFDGYGVLKLNLGNDRLANAISMIAFASFLVNFLPWLI
jgi:hypothetical protein